MDLKVGTRVEVTGKGVQGVIAFRGETKFAAGEWIGVILDEPKGKNNGSLKGVEYFKCQENHGVFVRPTQVVPLDETGKPRKSDEGKPSKIATRTRQSTGSVSGSTPSATQGTKPKPTTVRRKTSPQKSMSLSASSSRMSLASSRQSLAGSRQSLAGSRQSLSGSKSHLASPSLEKLSDIGDQISQIPKRASFVETGFVETLKPQFTQGQPINTPTPITSVEEKITNLQLQQEMDNRAQQIRDLTEKLETLKIKRQEDKERLKEYDKLKLQLEQLLEFKSKMMDAHAIVQRELQKAKLDAKEAIEAKEAHAEEVADLAEAVEMATLDKEMAEEKAETLQLELDYYKEKLEEVQLDLEILKTEMQSRTEGGPAKNEDAMSSYEIKQLQQQNERLRESVVRLRDMSVQDKHENQKLKKEIDQLKSEIAELAKTKEKLSVRIEDMEQQIADLQEQVDAALGAEEMVVILGEQKLTLEEKVSQLQEEVADLEALQDMNDQLVESNAELEADLREELDLAQAATREALRERDAALETIADRESTIGKFRQLVQQLQEQSMNLQERLEKETSKPVSGLPEIIDFKKMFTESKAQTKAIDLELRRIDIQQLQQHIKYLTSYMPESFMNRGGDHDAVLVLLLVPRLIHKIEILNGQIKDKFPAANKIDRQSVLKGHSVEQYSFKCRISYFLGALQAILHQYYYGLNTCKPEALLKIGATYPEMLAQEKIVDGFVELVKRDQLDENVPLDSLEKCVGYFNTLFPVLLGIENRVNQTQLLADNVKALSNAAEAFNNDAMVIRCLIESANVGDIGLLAQHIISTAEQIQQQLKLIKRRLPPDMNMPSLGLNKEIVENLYQCYQHAGKIIRTLHDIVKSSVQALTTTGDSEKGLTQEKIKDIAITASDKIYEQDDLGPVQSIKTSLSHILTQVSQLAQFLQDKEYEISTMAAKKIEKPVAPVQVRAEAVKRELEQTKTLTSKLENKESDIKELKKLLKEKQEQLSEMTIRKELAEKKLANVNKDYELQIEKLQRKCEESQNNAKKKEKEFEEAWDQLQHDIDSLESEKRELREKLKMMTKKAQMEASMTKSVSGSQLSSLSSSLGGPTLPAVVRDSPLLMQEIDNYKKLFNQERNLRIKLENEKIKQQLDSLVPLPTFKSTHDEVLENLFKEGAALKQEILMALAKPKFPTIWKLKPGNGPAAWQKHFVEEKARMDDLKQRAEAFQNKVAQEAVKRKFGGRIEADFAVFPTKEMVHALNESKTVNIGFVKIPRKLVNEESAKIVNLEVDFANLQKILHALSA